MRNNQPVTEREVSFHGGDCLPSTTDLKGVITDVNKPLSTSAVTAPSMGLHRRVDNVQTMLKQFGLKQ